VDLDICKGNASQGPEFVRTEYDNKSIIIIMHKTVKILRIKPDGPIKLKDVKLKKTSFGLDICKGNASQGHEFVRTVISKNIFILIYSQTLNVVTVLILAEHFMLQNKKKSQI